ncbi:hypothetical protein [Tenacibaculum jejuense]|uniref:Uncharacterized protein n=1 Tax=Tenacibaculum jejuense TaxID=584609 RepID=A0A238UBE1_9FLAO|nr:hypothetical protein [Tenacibaculum jejuense]SNR15804.1 protein of unknown function [Tenacibaculum jejuense]
MSKTIQIFIGAVLALIFGLYFYFKGRSSKSTEPKSNDNSVAEAISVIDQSIDKFLFRNKDHEPIFDVVSRLNSSQILKLHKDFGLRYHDSTFGIFSWVPVLDDAIGAETYNLSAILLREFDENQKQRIKAIYKSKGLVFPLVNPN